MTSYIIQYLITRNTFNVWEAIFFFPPQSAVRSHSASLGSNRRCTSSLWQTTRGSCGSSRHKRRSSRGGKQHADCQPRCGGGWWQRLSGPWRAPRNNQTTVTTFRGPLVVSALQRTHACPIRYNTVALDLIMRPHHYSHRLWERYGTSAQVRVKMPKFYHTDLLMRSTVPWRRIWGGHHRRSRTIPSMVNFSCEWCWH